MARNEGITRVSLPQQAAFEMWADLSRLGEFLPEVIDSKKVGDGVYALTLLVGGVKDTTRVALSVIEKPRRLVWRSKGGAKWNGELVLRPTTDGTELRLIIDYEPSSLRDHPTERGVVVPEFSAGEALHEFKLFAEKAHSDAEEAEAVGA